LVTRWTKIARIAFLDGAVLGAARLQLERVVGKQDLGAFFGGATPRLGHRVAGQGRAACPTASGACCAAGARCASGARCAARTAHSFLAGRTTKGNQGRSHNQDKEPMSCHGTSPPENPRLHRTTAGRLRKDSITLTSSSFPVVGFHLQPGRFIRCPTKLFLARRLDPAASNRKSKLLRCSTLLEGPVVAAGS
jgi:hypothetical protein